MAKDFVLYRLPDTEEVIFQNLSKKTGSPSQFLFHSFDDTKSYIFDLENTETFTYTTLDGLSLDIELGKKPDVTESSKNEYLERCNQFIKALRENEFQKLILSRIKWMQPIENPKKQFLTLCKKYPSAFVYLANFDGQTWMGASPERLVQIEGNHLKTVALAGTRAVSDNREWTEKEHEEHQLVTDYIVQELSSLQPNVGKTETVRLGAIEHLQTKISAEISEDISVMDISNQLHPTPAICGIPKKKAKQFILAHEGYDRSLYTGYFGVVSNEKAEIFVNLRCAQLYQDATAVYVGGGLLAASDAELEWQETEWKAKALF